MKNKKTIKLTKETKKKAYEEGENLNFNNLEIGVIYSYKKICSLIGATYLGSYSNGIKKQKEYWKQYIDFEEIEGKLKITGIVSDDEEDSLNRKEKLIREELGRSKYYGIMYDAIMLTMLESLKKEYTRDKGKIVDIDGQDNKWIFLEKSYLKWQVSIGLLSEQFRKYYNKLTGSYTGLIASQKIVHLTNDIFKRFLKKLEAENSMISLTKGVEIMVIDFTKKIPPDDKRKNQYGIKYGEDYYKFIIESASPQLIATINVCKNNVVKSLGYRNEEEAYKNGKKKIIMEAVGRRLGDISYKNDEICEGKFSVDENGEVKPLYRYKIVNYWDTLIIGVSFDFLLKFIRGIKNKINEKEDEGKGTNGFIAQSYLDELRDEINQNILVRLLGKIERDGETEGNKKNDGIPFYDSYNITTIESISGKVAKEIFEIKKNNKEFFDSVEWRQGGIVPLINKNDEIVGALEEQEDGNIRVYDFDGSCDSENYLEDETAAQIIGDRNKEGETERVDDNSVDSSIELSYEAALKMLEERREKTGNLVNDITNNYIDIAKGLITIFNGRGENNYSMADIIRLAQKQDVREIFKQIKQTKQTKGV